MAAVHSVFMDESGTHAGSPVMAVAGYVFSDVQARRFTRDWSKDLARYGLPFGHMTDCATGNGHYKPMSKVDRDSVARALIVHTRHRSSLGFGVAVDLVRYRSRINSYYDHDAYTFCLMMCVHIVHKWAVETNFNGRLSYIFESGHHAQAEANSVMNAITKHEQGKTYFSHSFVTKTDAPPLQAADMLAWQFAHYLKRKLNGHPKRKDFVALLRPGDKLINITDTLVDEWRKMQDQKDLQILDIVKQRFSNPGTIAYVMENMKRSL